LSRMAGARHRPAEDAAAVVLPVETEGAAQPAALPVTVPLFEIGLVEAKVVTLPRLHPDAVDEGRVFVGADGQCGPEAIKVMSGRGAGCLLEPRAETDGAPRSSLGRGFVSVGEREPVAGLIDRGEEAYILVSAMAFRFHEPAPVFALGMYVGVVEVSRHVKRAGEQVEYMRRAWSAAYVEQEFWFIHCD